jgi:hypothetical protein
LKAAVVYVRGIAGVTLLIAFHMGAAGRQSPQGDESVAGETAPPSIPAIEMKPGRVALPKGNAKFSAMWVEYA